MFLKFNKNADNLPEAFGISDERTIELADKCGEAIEKCETFFDIIDDINNDDTLSKEELVFLLLQLGAMHAASSMKNEIEEEIEREKEENE